MFILILIQVQPGIKYRIFDASRQGENKAESFPRLKKRHVSASTHRGGEAGRSARSYDPVVEFRKGAGAEGRTSGAKNITVVRWDGKNTHTHTSTGFS